MELQIADRYKNLAIANEAKNIVQQCVHCGFCNATCPTYQLLGDELDGPRGRIYLMKSMLEGNATSRLTNKHLDRCLTCRACETTCPSGVKYGRLLEIGREIIKETRVRTLKSRLIRFLLRRILVSTKVVRIMILIAQPIKLALSNRWAKHIPPYRSPSKTEDIKRSRYMLLLDGCVQPAIAPSINTVAKKVLNKAGISLLVKPNSGCCGALSLHLDGTAEAKRLARKNIDAWWPDLVNGCEAIVMTASGCGVTVREYGQLLVDDQAYSEKALKVSSIVRDLSEVVASEKPPGLKWGDHRHVAFHSPCTLQHGQRVNGLVEKILASNGWNISEVKDQHMCCGSAGTYSFLQSDIANNLREAKLVRLKENSPELIASANLGCIMHLGKASDIPVVHWIELLDQVD